MLHPERGDVLGERLGGELWPVVGEDPGQLDIDGLEPLDDQVEEVDGVGRGELADI